MNPTRDPAHVTDFAGPKPRSRWARLWRPRHSLTLWSINFWRERLTRAGRYAMIGALTTAIAASFPEHMIGSYAFSFFLSLLLISLGISLVRRPRVSVTRTVPDRVMVGADAELSMRVTNPTARPAFDIGACEFRTPMTIRVEPDAQYIDRLEPRASHLFQYTLNVRRRGHYTLPGPSVLSAFPFGLTNAIRFQPQRHHLVAYPAFHPLQGLDLSPAHSYQPGGVALASQVGDAMEFVGSRPYRPGDRVRDLHPRSWARVGEPVVRQYADEFIIRVAMVVDTYVPSGFGIDRRGPAGARKLNIRLGADDELLEANLSLAASVADYLARQEYVVDLFAAGPQLFHFQSGRSLAYLDNILDILASIDRSRHDPFEVIAPSFCQQLRQTSTVVVLLAGWDDRRAAFVETIREAGVPLRLIVTTDDPQTARAAEEAGATHLNTHEIREGVVNL